MGNLLSRRVVEVAGCAAGVVGITRSCFFDIYFRVKPEISEY